MAISESSDQIESAASKASQQTEYDHGALPDHNNENFSTLVKVRRYVRKLFVDIFEARGIHRVLPPDRHASSYSTMFTLWFSINLAANNLTLGMLGPTVFYLSFLDASLCAVCGTILGCLPVCYIACFGPRSGNRSLVVARYAMGWWPVKIVVLLNILNLLGYALIDAVIAGQILSAISSPPGSLSVVVGIIIVAVITWVITTFGYVFLNSYLKYAWIPQIIVFSILAGTAGPSFDLSAPTRGDMRTRVGSRLSFFSLCYSAAALYAGEGADYYVYYPVDTRRLRVFATVLVALLTSFAYSLILGIGLASGVTTNAAWAAAYETSQGALIVEAFRPLGTFGNFCSVVVALGLVANIIPTTYSGGVDFQILGHIFERVPRAFWNTVQVIIYTACAAAGRDHLSEIFTNFLALMGYWVSIWIAIMLEEHLLFRRYFNRFYQNSSTAVARSDENIPTRKLDADRSEGFDWSTWDSPDKLPVGVAALIAFLIGWAGAVISMAQVWYIGPIAKLVGQYGADMGNYVAFSWTVLVFPPLRYLELKYFKR